MQRIPFFQIYFMLKWHGSSTRLKMALLIIVVYSSNIRCYFLYSDTVNLIDESKNKHCIQHHINRRGSITVCLRSYSWKPASICRWTSLLQPLPPPPLELEQHNFKNWKTLVLKKTNHRFFYFFDEMGRGSGFA